MTCFFPLQIWWNNWFKYSRTARKSFLDDVLTMNFGDSTLSKTCFKNLSRKSCEKLFLYELLFGVSTSWWNLAKSENKLKHWKNGLTSNSLVIFRSKAIRHWSYFSINNSIEFFPFSRRLLMLNLMSIDWFLVCR